MQPAYYEDFTEIKKKIWSMLDDAVTNRSSQFRIPTFICGHNNDIDGRIVVLRKSDQQNNLHNLQVEVLCLIMVGKGPNYHQKKVPSPNPDRFPKNDHALF